MMLFAGRARMAVVTLSATVCLVVIGAVVLQRQASARDRLEQRRQALIRLEKVQAACDRGELPTRARLNELESLFGGARLSAERRGDAVCLVFDVAGRTGALLAEAETR